MLIVGGTFAQRRSKQSQAWERRRSRRVRCFARLILPEGVPLPPPLVYAVAVTVGISCHLFITLGYTQRRTACLTN